jgi:hypothetical protein
MAYNETPTEGEAMFNLKNKAVQIKMVTTTPDETVAETTTVKTVDPAEIAQIATDYTLKTIGAIGAVIAGHKVLTTICDIAVIAAKAKIK